MSQTDKILNQKGLTLLEVLVSIMLLTTLTLGVLQVLRTGFTVSANEEKAHSVREIYNEFVIMINRDVKNAIDVSISNQSNYDELYLTLSNGSIIKYKYQDDGKFYYNNRYWFNALKSSESEKAIEFNETENIIKFHLEIVQEDKPAMPLEFSVSPRFKEVE